MKLSEGDKVKVKRDLLKALSPLSKDMDCTGKGKILYVNGSIITVKFDSGYIGRYFSGNLIPADKLEIE